MGNIYTEETCGAQFIYRCNSAMPSTKNIILAAYDYDVSHYSRILFKQLDIHLPEVIKSSVLKRQAEYLAGRYAARSALDSLGVKVNNIGTGMNRSPIWPPGISASITHTDTRAICAASYKTDHKYLGIDLEKRLSSKCVAEIKDSIINVQEECLLLNNELGFEDAFTLTFSAKESLFKALHPSVGTYFDFSAAQITRICCNTNTFTVILLEDLTTELITGQEYTGTFSFNKTYVFTMIA